MLVCRILRLFSETTTLSTPETTQTQSPSTVSAINNNSSSSSNTTSSSSSSTPTTATTSTGSETPKTVVPSQQPIIQQTRPTNDYDFKRALLRQQIADYQEEILDMMDDVYSYGLPEAYYNNFEMNLPIANGRLPEPILRQHQESFGGNNEGSDGGTRPFQQSRSSSVHQSQQKRRNMRLVPFPRADENKIIRLPILRPKVQTQVEPTPSESIHVHRLQAKLRARQKLLRTNFKPLARSSIPSGTSNPESYEEGARRWTLRSRSTPSFRDPDFERARVRLNRQRKVGKLLGQHPRKHDPRRVE